MHVIIQLMPASMLTVGEVAQMLHIHENTVRRWSNRGIIKPRKINMRGDRRFKKEEVEAVLTRLNNNNGDERIST
jgi:excisionase family DNA binding protein